MQKILSWVNFNIDVPSRNSSSIEGLEYSRIAVECGRIPVTMLNYGLAANP